MAVVLFLGTVPCASQHTGPTWAIDAQFTEVFWIGDEESERQFGDVAAMEFTPDGRHLVVLDRLEFRVVVYDMEGAAVASWGRQGDGPGEFRRPPRELAVSGEGLIAIGYPGSAELFDIHGKPIDTRSFRGRGVIGMFFDDRERLLVEAVSLRAVSLGEEPPLQLIRLDDDEVLWTSRPVLHKPGGVRMHLYGAVPMIDPIGDNRVVVGHTDRYDFAILDAGTGQEVGRIRREVPVRAVTANHRRARMDLYTHFNEVTFAESFPVATRVFAGPSGRLLWVRRDMGVGDELAPPVESMIESLENPIWRLYDLFRSDGGNYYGTVEVPEGFLLLATAPGFVAGVHRDEWGRESVRVFRVRVSMDAPHPREPIDVSTSRSRPAATAPAAVSRR